MFGLFRKNKSLSDYLRKNKTVNIDGFIFVIKKISIEDHLAGLNVILNINQLYQKESKPSPETAINNVKELKKFLRDIIFAGVVEPKLNITKVPSDDLHVDELLSDLALSQKLAGEIIALSYGKKK